MGFRKRLKKDRKRELKIFRIQDLGKITSGILDSDVMYDRKRDWAGSCIPHPERWRDREREVQERERKREKDGEGDRERGENARGVGIDNVSPILPKTYILR